VHQLEGIFLWTGMFSYLFGFAFFLAVVTFKKEAWQKRGWYLVVAGLIAQTASMVTRWIVSGHPPVQGNYENSLLGSWFLILVYFYGVLKYPRMKTVGAFIIPAALMVLGWGLKTPVEIEPLTPPYQSNWLWIHVNFAWLAFGAFTVATALGIVYLFKERREYPQEHFLTKYFPGLDQNDDLILGFIAFGFVSQALMIGSGSIWASSLWGSYWSWDPVETWSLICWAAYGLILHLRLTWGWRGRRLAWLAVVALPTVIIYFWGIGFVNQLHTPLFR